MIKYLKKLILVVVIGLFFTTSAYAVSILTVQQGGTGVGTITGIIQGNGTSPFSSITVGPGLLFSGGTLSATGGGGSATTTINGVLGPTFTFNPGTSGSDFNIATSSGTVTFNFPNASASNRGLLTSTDWSTFNGKQASGNYLTALTGDGTASGLGSSPLTLATVNSNVGTFGSATQAGVFTVNGKGLITAASNTTVTPAVGSITGLGTGVATWLTTPSSANLATVVTDETGSGPLVFSTSPTLTSPVFVGIASPTYSAGKFLYDTDNESLTFYNNDSNVSLQVGQEEWIRVKNVTGSTIPNGAVVYLNGANSGLPTIALAQSNSGATTVGVGLTTESISNNAIGYVTSTGVVHGLDTSAFSAGSIVFISSTVAGGLTSTAPTAPNFRYRVGIVAVSDASVGSILVTPSTAALGNGTANQVFGINNSGTAQEVKSILGTANEITVTNTANTITSSLPSALTFTGKTITGGAYVSPTITTKISPTSNDGAPLGDTTHQFSDLFLAEGGVINWDNGDATLTQVGDILTLGGAELDVPDLAYASTWDGSLAVPTRNAVYDANFETDNTIKAYQSLGSVIKAQTVTGDISKISAGLNLTSGLLKFLAVYIPRSQTITGVKWYQTTKGNYTGDANNLVGLYSYSAGTMTLVASSTNDATLWQTANSNTIGSKAFQSTYSANPGLYYVAILYHASAAVTAPALASQPTIGNAAQNSVDFTNSATLVGQITTQTVLPNPTQLMSGVTSFATPVWLALY